MATPSIIITLPATGSRRIPGPGTWASGISAHIAANVIWAGSAVASKPLLDHMPPLTLAALRVAIAYALLRMILSLRHERPATGRAPALLGLTGVALFCGGMNIGLLFVDASVTALLSGFIPVLTILLAAPILHERLRGGRLAGVLVSMTGIGIIAFIGQGGAPGMAALEVLLPLASALGSALYMVLGRRAMLRESPLAVVTGSTGYGLLILLPGAAYEILTVGPGSLSAGDALLLLYLGAGCSGIAFVLRGYGLTRLGAGHGAIYGNLRPVVGVVLAALLLREPLTSQALIGGLVVLAGVALAGRRERSNPDRSRLPAGVLGK